MVIFLTVVFTIYFLVNSYLFIRGYRALAGNGYPTGIYSALFIILASTFVAGKFLEHSWSNVFTDVLNVIGGFWMAFMMYGFMFWIVADIFFLIQKPFGLIAVESMPRIRLLVFGGITGGAVILIVAGFINAVLPSVTRYDINLNRHLANGDDHVRIVAVSDIHLGSVIRKRSMRHLSEMIRREKPDLVLFLGDVIDGSIGPVLRDDILSDLKLPELKYGHYAITGNHEFIGGLDKTVPYIESKGIRVLKDEVVSLPNGLQIAGRLDMTAAQRFVGTGGRASLDSLLAKTDTARPVILLDHQPYNLSELAGTGVDLQLSGHTHDGQMWPINYITSGMFEVSYGLGRFGNTNVIVSSGFGLWGPRVRIGTKSEIVVIDLRNGSEK